MMILARLRRLWSRITPSAFIPSPEPAARRNTRLARNAVRRTALRDRP